MTTPAGPGATKSWHGDSVQLLHAYLELEAEGVNGNSILARMLLQHPSHEALGEEEARQPEAAGRAIDQPVAHEGHACMEVCHPAA